MLQRCILFVFLLTGWVHFGQNEQLAQNYFDSGSFEKALVSYQELLKTNPGNGIYFLRTIECYQQLEQYDKAEKELNERLLKYKQATLLIELGYNYQLQKNTTKAESLYEEALLKINEAPTNVYSVASTFEKKVLLQYALKAYETAYEVDPKSRFNYQMGLLFGQLGQPDKMIEKFLEELYTNPQNSVLIQNQLSRFMNDDTDEQFNNQLRKALLVRAQQNQDIFWNQMLSWYFVQQKDYGKAFIQEKAIYKREPETFSNIVSLGEMVIEAEENDLAKEIFNFILENTNDLDLQIQSHYYLMQIQIDQAVEKDYATIDAALELLLKKYGVSPYTLSIQLMQANFVTFKRNNPEQGKAILNRTMELPLNRFQLADAKMELADILLFENKFNQALIYYTQIQEDLKNDVIGHEASLKAAKTSYFNVDFDWALTQLKVLKTASTQLIANDALELFLLINDNTVADSTQAALKRFAKADFLVYQNKKAAALKEFQTLLQEHQSDVIADATLLRIGTLYEDLKDTSKALEAYQKIIDDFPESIYRDEALYFSAEIYHKKLKMPDKAKALYESLLFNHQDSIHFVDARRKYRQLRGDSNL
ncbi:tetratricopeptide repeat protein [Flavobacterium sp. UBA6135]|uniref:tetratricopeptide repeat protein n=1 Tax=Flavobacterium sp. UBA6135 TaxID=1946553 RepID=UPI0025C00610|nr:tetratricopeptide repeat protein [Flavobacterium sp. UBA6135]